MLVVGCDIIVDVGVCGIVGIDGVGYAVVGGGIGVAVDGVGIDGVGVGASVAIDDVGVVGGSISLVGATSD